MTSLHPPSFHRKDFSTCIVGSGERAFGSKKDCTITHSEQYECRVKDYLDDSEIRRQEFVAFAVGGRTKL